MARIGEMPPSFQAVSTTVRLDGKVPGGTTQGTGFFFDFARDENPMRLCIVTNRHVAENVTEMGVVFSMVHNGRRETRPFTMDNFQDFVIYHPDPDVDLCVIWLHRLIGAFPLLFNAEFDHAVINLANIPTEQDVEEMSAIESVVMVGYPIGLRDEVNNLPVARRGVTATPYVYDYAGKPDFMLDIACFHGSSGSPVYILDEGVYAGRNGLVISQGAARFFFLGVVKENRFETSTTHYQGAVEFDVNVCDPINVALCVKSRELLAFEPLLEDFAKRHGGW